MIFVALTSAAVPPRIMIDLSHANSGKDYEKQPAVANALAKQVADGSRSVFGLMLESFLVGGRQDNGGNADLTYGQSITDACMSWDATVPVLESLADAVRKRRAAGA